MPQIMVEPQKGEVGLISSYGKIAINEPDINKTNYSGKLVLRQYPQLSAADRAFDIFFSLGAILLFSPLMLLIVCLIKRYSPEGSVFFVQKRLGYQEKDFNCYKFRTMFIDAEDRLETLLESNPEIRQEYDERRKIRNDPRIIPGIGPILRKSSLDELPQFFNVLKGDLSVVGPRPISLAERTLWGKNIRVFHRVKPGITGIWQVSGRSDITYRRRIALERLSTRNKNMRKKLYVILKTMLIIIKPRGSY